MFTAFNIHQVVLQTIHREGYFPVSSHEKLWLGLLGLGLVLALGFNPNPNSPNNFSWESTESTESTNRKVPREVLYLKKKPM